MAVWASIYHVHHIFWISLWISMTTISIMMNKQQKKTTQAAQAVQAAENEKLKSS